MDDLVGRLLAFAFGCFVGGLGGALLYIISQLRQIKTEVDEVLDCEREKRRLQQKLDEGGFLERRFAVWIAYTFSIFLVMYAAYASYNTSQQLEQEVHDKAVAICRAQADTRFVERELVDQIYLLATGAIVEDPQDPWTAKDVAFINAYIDRVNDFRTNTYNSIKPTEICAPYVNDDNVEPTTPDFPHIKRQR